jgi:hypothetical protein
MALRFVLAWLLSTRMPLLVPATTAPVATVPAMADQMHPDEQDEKHDPNPVLR